MTEIPAFLRELFQGHGVASVIEGEWLVFPDYGTKIAGAIVQTNDYTNSFSVQLDIYFGVGPGKMIVESFAGFAETKEQALVDAQQNFVRNTFHVLLAAFFQPDDTQVSQEEWIMGEQKKRVTIGNIGMRGTQTEALNPSIDCMDRMQARLQSQFLPEGIHWVRLYYGHSGRRTVGCEVMFDNTEWKELQTEMAALPWPVRDEFYSLRVFLVIQGGVDVSQAVAVIHRMQQEDDAAIIEALIGLGTSRPHAEKLALLTPLAFGRFLLKQMPIRLADKVEVQNLETGTKRQIRLTNEPVYNEAYRLVEEGLAHQALTSDELGAIALRSAEVKVVNQAMQAGSRPENLQMSPPLLFWSEEKAQAEATPPVPPAKPRWQFWR